MARFNVDITPDKTLIQKLGLVGYRTEQAIAELLDNSIDARITDIREKIWVILNFEDKWIGVSDEGVGMGKEDLSKAMIIARGTKTDDRALGKFGMGMKSACSALGKKFVITTSKIDSDKEYEVEYDEDIWLSDESLNWTNFKINEKIQDEKNKWHGTKIVISKLKVPLYPNQVSKFKANFGIRYSPYLESNQILIQINSIFCNPEKIDIVKDSQIVLSIPLENNRIIHGYVALLKKRSIKGHYGIHLFKNNRLIKAFEKFGFSIHPEHAKVVGELHLDHVPVNFTKSEFIRESTEYRESEKAFINSEIVKKIISSSQSQSQPSPTIKSVLNYFAENTEAKTLTTKMRTQMAKELLENYEPFELQMKNTPVLFTFGIIDDDSLYEIHQDDYHMEVVINKNSHAFDYVTNPLFLIGIITSEIKLLISNSTHQSFLEQRNSSLSKFLNDWSQKSKFQSSRSREIPIPDVKHYGLSSDLQDIHDYLNEHYEFKFQFTSLSTLSSFLHNFLGITIYTIHTSPGKGEYLENIISKKFGEKFMVINSPNASILSQIMKISDLKKIIIVREYAEIKGSTVASPEKAWVDLTNEILSQLVPLSENELRKIYQSMTRRLPLDKIEIKRYAKHLKKLDKINLILGE